MKDSSRRITLVVPEELDLSLDRMKKEVFYNCSKSEMIRTLIMEGWKANMNIGEKENA